jgi:hypothetical protein
MQVYLFYEYAKSYKYNLFTISLLNLFIQIFNKWEYIITYILFSCYSY